jgi:hypothetical protein
MIERYILRKSIAVLLVVSLIGALPSSGLAAIDEDIAAAYPGLAEAERPAKRSAECNELRGNLKNLPELDRRVDLWVAGNLTAVQTDGALWYISLCLSPDIKVLCVTYQSNDMKVGDRIVAKGALMRPDSNHILLDPCLANTQEQEDSEAPATADK